MSDRFNREVIASLCEQVAAQTKAVVPDSDYEALRLMRMREDAENDSDWFREAAK